MSADEFASWMAFDRISPIGAFRADLNAATIAQTVANCHRGKGQRPFRARDFMPFYDPPQATDDQIGDAILAWGRQMQAALDQKKNRKRKKRNG